MTLLRSKFRVREYYKSHCVRREDRRYSYEIQKGAESLNRATSSAQLNAFPTQDTLELLSLKQGYKISWKLEEKQPHTNTFFKHSLRKAKAPTNTPDFGGDSPQFSVS